MKGVDVLRIVETYYQIKKYNIHVMFAFSKLNNVQFNFLILSRYIIRV